MKKIILIAAIVLVAATLGFGLIGKKVAPAAERFEGTVSAVDTSCFFDGICSVTVDGKRVIVVMGGRRIDPLPEVGMLKGVESIGDVEAHIGERAAVYAEKTAEGDYTIYGSAEYYVEILPKE